MRAAFGDELQNKLGKTGWEMSPFDAVTTYWVRNPDDMRGLLADPDWTGKMGANEEGWIDTERATVMAGFETIYIQDGKIVNLDIHK